MPKMKTNSAAKKRFDFTGTEGGDVEVGVGKYVVLCYNNDTEAVEFYNTGDFRSHGVYTREGSVLEPIYGNAANYAPRATGSEEQRVVICPEMMWGCTAMEVEVTDGGESNVRVGRMERTDIMSYVLLPRMPQLTVSLSPSKI